MKIVKVAAAILFFGNKILLTKRQQGKDYAGMWEFPGGKLENYETFKQALQRELFEELGLKVLEQNLEPYYYDEFVDGKKQQINIEFYLCKNYENIPESKEQQEIAYFAIKDIISLKMPPSDMGVLQKIALDFGYY